MRRGRRGRLSGLLAATAAILAPSLAVDAALAGPPAPPGKPAHAPAPSRGAAQAPLAPLPMLPSIPRVRIEVSKGHLVVIEEVNLPRGEWRGEALDFYVAFGAPGAPRAVDAHLVAVGDGELEPDDADDGDALIIDRAPRRPPTAHPLLGRDAMAGVVVHAKREALLRALAPGNMAALRMRTALDLPEVDSMGARGVVVRLGASRGTPLTLGRLSVVASPRAGGPQPARAEARLCGAEADVSPLAIAVLPRASPAAAIPAAWVIAPVLAVRHATDDLCIRFWTQ